jgi:hypothetical protein
MGALAASTMPLRAAPPGDEAPSTALVHCPRGIRSALASLVKRALPAPRLPAMEKLDKTLIDVPYRGQGFVAQRREIDLDRIQGDRYYRMKFSRPFGEYGPEQPEPSAIVRYNGNDSSIQIHTFNHRTGEMHKYRLLGLRDLPDRFYEWMTFFLAHDDRLYKVKPPKIHVGQKVRPVDVTSRGEPLEVGHIYTFTVPDEQQFFTGRFEGYDLNEDFVIRTAEGELELLHRKSIDEASIVTGKSLPLLHGKGRVRRTAH